MELEGTSAPKLSAVPPSNFSGGDPAKEPSSECQADPPASGSYGRHGVPGQEQSQSPPLTSRAPASQDLAIERVETWIKSHIFTNGSSEENFGSPGQRNPPLIWTSDKGIDGPRSSKVRNREAYNAETQEILMSELGKRQQIDDEESTSNMSTHVEPETSSASPSASGSTFQATHCPRQRGGKKTTYPPPASGSNGRHGVPGQERSQTLDTSMQQPNTVTGKCRAHQVFWDLSC